MDEFYPSRWRSWLRTGAVVALVLTVASLVLAAAGWPDVGPWLTALSLALGTANLWWSARRLGVTVEDRGVRVVTGGGWLGSRGTWRWDEILEVDVVEEEFVRDAPRQVVLRTVAGEVVRLGSITGRESMVDGIRSRLRHRSDA